MFRWTTSQSQFLRNRNLTIVRWLLTRFVKILATRKMDTFPGPYPSIIPFSSLYLSSDLEVTVPVCIPSRVPIISLSPMGYSLPPQGRRIWRTRSPAWSRNRRHGLLEFGAISGLWQAICVVLEEVDGCVYVSRLLDVSGGGFSERESDFRLVWVGYT